MQGVSQFCLLRFWLVVLTPVYLLSLLYLHPYFIKLGEARTYGTHTQGETAYLRQASPWTCSLYLCKSAILPSCWWINWWPSRKCSYWTLLILSHAWEFVSFFTLLVQGMDTADARLGALRSSASCLQSPGRLPPRGPNMNCMILFWYFQFPSWVSTLGERNSWGWFWRVSKAA